jgi:orotidine-5'-phosphate decarboxylase
MVKLLVALDVPTLDEAMGLAERVKSEADGLKVGLELLMGQGRQVLSRVGDLGLPVFADAKLHDIPNTVERAARQIGAGGARWLTAHASGGSDMLMAARTGLEATAGGPCGVMAITMLTSLDAESLSIQGITLDSEAYVMRMAAMAREAGAEGIVCSVTETHAVKAAFPDLVVVNPGIRPAGWARDDQSRTATPAQAAEAGSDVVVVGRPITSVEDPVAAARVIKHEIQQVVSATRG